VSSDNEHLKVPGAAFIVLTTARQGDDSPEVLDAARYYLGWAIPAKGEPLVYDKAIEAKAQRLLGVIRATAPGAKRTAQVKGIARREATPTGRRATTAAGVPANEPMKKRKA
jgi:hypothetical protein